MGFQFIIVFFKDCLKLRDNERERERGFFLHFLLSLCFITNKKEAKQLDMSFDGFLMALFYAEK